MNSWTFEAFPERKMLVLQHNHSDYKIEIPAVNMRGHEPPDMLSIRGKVFLEDDLKFSFEPFTEGMSASDPSMLVDDPFERENPRLYKTLKPHEGERVTVRFPRVGDGTTSSPIEAILQEVTPHFAKLEVEEFTILFRGIAENDIRNVLPGYTRTISLQFINYEEDDEKEGRPRLVIDYSHWNTNS